MNLDYRIIVQGSRRLISFYDEPPLSEDDLWMLMAEKYEDDPAMYAELGKIYLELTHPTMTTRSNQGEE